jgi:hypothetical protein
MADAVRDLCSPPLDDNEEELAMAAGGDEMGILRRNGILPILYWQIRVGGAVQTLFFTFLYRKKEDFNTEEME